MKDAMKRREMDERTTRLLVLAKAADQALRPLKTVMEGLKPIYEVLDKVKSVPVVTDYKPLRAPGYPSRAHSALSPALDDRPSQNPGGALTQKAQGSGLPNDKNEKQRTNNLERAVEAAMKKLGRMATVDELINFLAQSDETGFIRRWDGEEIVWINSKGKEQKTGRRGIEIHRQKYR